MNTSDVQAIRRVCLERRRHLPMSTQIAAASHINHLIKNLSVYQQAKRVAFYNAINGEINLHELLMHAHQQQKQCYLPRMNPDQTLSFLPVTRQTPSQRNPLNIHEPLVPERFAMAPEHIDLIIAPVVAFDQHGTRVGHGHGYYDRTLANHPPACLLGVAYSFQQHDVLPRQTWDVPLHGMVTEHGVQWFR